MARVAAAASAAHAHGMVLTARCEHHIRGVDDLDGTVHRLEAYREAGADALFAPGVRDLDAVARLVGLDAPLNVLVMPGAPTVPELAAAGVRRISVGGMLTWTMYGALVASARHLLEHGTLDPDLPLVDREVMTDGVRLTRRAGVRAGGSGRRGRPPRSPRAAPWGRGADRRSRRSAHRRRSPRRCT